MTEAERYERYGKLVAAARAIGLLRVAAIAEDTPGWLKVMAVEVCEAYDRAPPMTETVEVRGAGSGSFIG